MSFVFRTLAAAALAAAASAQSVIQTQYGAGMDDAEITPDGRWAVVRPWSYTTRALIFDLSSGALLHTVSGGLLNLGPGACQDAVAVTNDRAVVIVGNVATILDLTGLPSSVAVVAEHDGGYWPRDVAITPDGMLAVVRGGSGTSVFDLASGAKIAFAPGPPPDTGSPSGSFSVDSVAVTDDHAVGLSGVGTAPSSCRVTILDLHPSGGGPPVVVFETSASGPIFDQSGMPYDLAITPDGKWAAVRSKDSVALYSLNGPSSTQAWDQPLFGPPGSTGSSPLDSIEVTNDRMATIGRWTLGGTGTQLDVFDLAGAHKYDRFAGDPHDLALTPDGRRLVLRTQALVRLYDIESLPANQQMPPLSSADVVSTHTSYLAGVDSVAVTNELAVTLARNNAQTVISIWRIGNDQLDLWHGHLMLDPPLDLSISPDESWVAVAGTRNVRVVDLLTGQVALDHKLNGASTYFPWCDGAVLDDDRAVFFGYNGIAGGVPIGWVEIVDLFSQSVSYCSAGVNSTGDAAEIHATGSASVATNDLDLWASGLPASAYCLALYAVGPSSTPFGDGTLCLAPPIQRFPANQAGADGVAHQLANFTGPRFLGGAITAGTTWHFQLLYLDPSGPLGSGFNLTDGISIPFTN